MRKELHETTPLDWIKHIVLGVAEGAIIMALPVYFAMKHQDQVREWLLAAVRFLGLG